MTAASSLVCQAADTSSALLAKLKSDYPVSQVGIIGLKFDYNHIVQPGAVLSVHIPGIYADPANTPQAIVNTVIANGQAQQQRGLLSALSSTAQGRTFNLDEQVYVTKIDLRQDCIHFQLLSAGNAFPRYRAEVKFLIPNVNAMDAASVEQIISAAVSVPGREGPQTEPAQASIAPRPRAQARPSRPGVAVITAEQEERIAAQINRAPAALSKQVGEAAETLKAYIGLNACLNDFGATRSQLQTYIGPHGDLNGYNPPFANMRFHDKGTCLDVTRIQGWNSLSLNAFEFQVVYTAADSGESSVRTHAAQREPDGTWLMNH